MTFNVFMIKSKLIIYPYKLNYKGLTLGLRVSLVGKELQG